jgi:hypothetical protein
MHQLLAQYNSNYLMTPALDRHFATLAQQNIRLHPLRFYFLLPAARTLDMWLRPRTEMFPLDSHFWRFRADPSNSIKCLLIALLNLGYLAAALAFVITAWRHRQRIAATSPPLVRHLGLLVIYPIVRTLFLATTGASEDRYTLECFPFILVLASGWLARYSTSNE